MIPDFTFTPLATLVRSWTRVISMIMDEWNEILCTSRPGLTGHRADLVRQLIDQEQRDASQGTCPWWRSRGACSPSSRRLRCPAGCSSRRPSRARLGRGRRSRPRSRGRGGLRASGSISLIMRTYFSMAPAPLRMMVVWTTFRSSAVPPKCCSKRTLSNFFSVSQRMT
jgi:hypothetical protein